MKFLFYFERAKNKIYTLYTNALFRSMVKSIPKGEKPLFGHMYLYNTNIVLGKNVHIWPGVTFWGNGEIVIGDNVGIGANTILYSSKEGGIVIGDNVQIAAQGYIIDMDHGIEAGTPIISQENHAAKIVIGKDSWIGANVTILKGSKIGEGAVIGAKSLIKGEIKDNEIVAGVPAKHIRFR